MYKFMAYINGEFIDSSEKVTINNPTTNQPAGVIPALKTVDINKAFEAARIAFDGWASINYKKRIKYIETFRDLVLKNQALLAKIIMTEIAKNEIEATSEVLRSVDYINGTIKAYREMMLNPITYDSSYHGAEGKVATYLRVPLGVVLAISPFNYPINLLLTKIVPALIVGNSVVYKSATQGSLLGGKIAELLNEANLPNGVINYVTGRGRDIGDILVAHENIAMITFTGGTTVGENISKNSKMIPLVLELGGKDPALVLSDCNLALTAKRIVKGAFGFNGQRCTAIKRVLVQDDIANELVALITKETNALTVGKPSENTNITPLIDSKVKDYNLALTDDALSKGARLTTQIKHKDNLLWPIVLDDVTTAMDVAWEEPFGPILPIIRFTDINEAIKIINDSQYGLQASIFSENINYARALAEKIEAGTININRASSRGPDILPFLGVKSSGFGIQGIKDAIYSMTTIRGIIINK